MKKQKEFEESLKVKVESSSDVVKIRDIEKLSDSDLLFNKAMKLITEAESSVRSYELSIKKEILLIENKKILQTDPSAHFLDSPLEKWDCIGHFEVVPYQ